MTSDFTFDGEIESTEEFETALEELLLVALQNDVDPGGSWVYRTDGVGQDLEVMVFELLE
jgi:hypothetical protein